MLFEVRIDALQTVPLPQVAPIAEVPAVIRDIAIWVPEELPAARVFEEIARLSARDGRLAALREVRLFDVFRPSPGSKADAPKAPANVLLNKEKSLAFRVVLQDTRRSLSDSDADSACDAIVEHLTITLGGRRRQ
jgi:phenylalanyl-tRNA synthetase beta chain